MSNITAIISESPTLTSTIDVVSSISSSTFSEGGRTLSELTDVDLQGVTDGSLLVYDTNEFVARTLSGDATINSQGVLTLNPNSVTLGVDTSGAYVSTITGTADQITVLGSGGETANVTLSLPQSLATSSSPTFNNITLTGVINNADLDARLQAKTQDWSNIVNLPTTLAGYGISDAVDTFSSQVIAGSKEFSTCPTVPLVPTAAGHAASKAYVDTFSEGLHVHAAVHAILTSSLETAIGGAATIDYTNGTNGVNAKLTASASVTWATVFADSDVTIGSRVIVAGQDTSAYNGIYTISSATELTRASDFNSPTEMAGGDFVFVTHGTYADTGWVLSEPVTQVGVSPVIFTQFSGAGAYEAGDGLSRDGTVFNVVAGDGITVDGSVSLSASGVTAGTYKSVAVDSYGRVTSGSNPTTLSGYGITDAASSTALSNHASDASVHLTSTQNTQLDTLTSLPTPSTLTLRDSGGRLHATQLRLHGENFYSQLNFAPNPTQDISFEFPNTGGAIATTAFVNSKASNVNPLMNGTVAIGTSAQYAREDHVHPVDTSRAPLISPSFSGNPTALNPDPTSNSNRIATTAFVTTKVSTLAPLASPAFTGTPTAPTPLSTSNDTSIATTSFVTSKLGGGIGGVVDLTSDQTIAGTKTFTGQLVLNFSQNQLVLKNGTNANAMLITVPAALTANRTITIPDVGFSGSVVLNVGPQNISGVKTFTTSPVVPTPTASDQAANKGYVDGVVLGNHTHTASAISDSTAAGRAILTAADHPAQITALSNITDTSSTTINLTAADSGKILRCTSSNAVTINMPSTDPGGNFTVAVVRSGTGTVTFAANGKTLNSYNNLLTIAGQHAWASVIREAVDVYNLSGTLSL